MRVTANSVPAGLQSAYNNPTISITPYRQDTKGGDAQPALKQTLLESLCASSATTAIHDYSVIRHPITTQVLVANQAFAVVIFPTLAITLYIIVVLCGSISLHPRERTYSQIPLATTTRLLTWHRRTHFNLPADLSFVHFSSVLGPYRHHNFTTISARHGTRPVRRLSGGPRAIHASNAQSPDRIYAQT